LLFLFCFKLLILNIFSKVLKTQFALVSVDQGKSIKKDEVMKLYRACGQNLTISQLELGLVESKLETKTSLTFEEVHLLAQKTWMPPGAAKNPPQQPGAANNVNKKC
jgi:hypothetical protein